MSSPQVLVGKRGKRVVDFIEDPDTAWRLMCWIGLGLGLVAYADLSLLLYPLRFGNAEWEFGTFSRLFDSMPLATVATMLFFAGSVARGSRWATRGVGLWSAVVGLLLVVALLLYALNIPLALRAVTNPVAASGLKKAIVKSLIQGPVYATLFFGMGFFGWRIAGRVKHQLA